jgi:hypothetical protein
MHIPAMVAERSFERCDPGHSCAQRRPKYPNTNNTMTTAPTIQMILFTMHLHFEPMPTMAGQFTNPL